MAENITSLLKEAENSLAAAGIEDAEFSAKAILAFVLNKKIIDLHLEHDSVISDREKQKYNDLINKRAGFYPLQYILGTVEFFNTNLLVNEDVLIPRPETELLAETAAGLVKANRFKTAMDIGTGCGNLAIALACANSELQVTAVDVSETALAIALANVRGNNVENRVSVRQADCLTDDFWSETTKYDLIIANPPYLEPDELITLQKEIIDFEPKVALTPGPDPLLFYKVISSRAGARLNRPGLLAFEVGYGLADKVKSIIETNFPKADITIKKDYGGIDRMVFAFLKE